MKKLITLALFALTLGFFMTSCGGDKKDGDDPVVTKATCDDGIQNQDETGIDCGGVCSACPIEFNVVEDDLDGDGKADQYVVSGITNQEFTFTSDKIWVLSGKVVVAEGGKLTIQPGTIIKGSQGTGSLASALVVARGGSVMAVGTAAKPIIMTSVLDNIKLGEKAGTNLDSSKYGLWGGLIVLGKAPCSFKNDVAELQIEGIPASNTYGLYGGTVKEDNSGEYAYISIRHGGALIGADNEINGLTLGGVGSGTKIHHIEVVANQDDGVEFFGGTVNASELLVWAQGDDGLDIDQAYAGTVSNSMVILGESSDHGLEIDGPEGAKEENFAQFTLDGITLVGNLTTSKGEYADYRSNAMGTTKNIYAYGFKDSSDVELDNNKVSQNFLDKKLTFENWQVVGFDHNIFKEKVAKDKNDNPIEEKIILNPTFTERAAAWTKQVTTGTVGADVNEFAWTYAKAQGAF